MRLFCLSVLLVSVFLSAKPAIAATELEEREAIASKAREAFAKERFAELDEMERRYRVNKTRTPSGVWCLTWFYEGIGRGIENEIDRGESDPWRAFRKVDAKTLRWIRKYPKPSPASVIATSTLFIKEAWAYRGAGPSRTISAENVGHFHRVLSSARSVLEVWKQQSAIDPQWYETMMIVARGQNWRRAEFESLLDEAVKKEPLFYPTYFQALEYLLPKWHGSVDDIEAFAQKAADGTSKLDGQALYARIYWFAWETEFRDKLFTDTVADWPRMKAGFDDMVAKYPDKWNLTAYARFACQAGDRETTRDLVGRIGPDAMASLWRPGRTRERCSDWAQQEATGEAFAH